MSHAPADHCRHCPRCGRATFSTERTNPYRCAACGFLLFFNPAAAVAALIVRDDGFVLFVRRALDPGKGQLGLPGGFVDHGETAEAALRREVREEVGLELLSPTYLASFPNRYRFADVLYETLDLFYLSRCLDASVASPLDAVSQVVWADPLTIDLDVLAFESMRRAIEFVRTSPQTHLPNLS